MRVNPFLVAATLALAGLSAAQAAPSAATGKETFHRVGCYQCHNYQGQGAGGPRLTAVTSARLHSYVRTANGDMPAYRPSVLSDAEIDDIYAYLQSVPKGPAPDSIPAIRNLKK